MRNALAHAPAKQRTAVAAMLKTIFAQETKAEAEAQWAVVADALREKQPKLGALMDTFCHWGLGSSIFRAFRECAVPGAGVMLLFGIDAAVVP
jgi:hypothetical protein